MAGAVPVVTFLGAVYPEDAEAKQLERWKSVVSSFSSTYGGSPEFISRSPGRVNIIGEHIDYSLYEVLPMAVTADIIIAVSTTDEPVVKIGNTQHERFPRREYGLPEDGNIDIDSSSLEWTNYFKAGQRGAIELLMRKNKGSSDLRLKGMNVVVDGSVPSGAGLSSSAAFVCASALAVLRANGVDEVDKQELVELAIVSERAVGVNSGGMDQSASVFSLRGSALYVSFKPTLHARNISFPETKSELTFLVAQSLVAADKHTSGPVGYNLRVVECSLAALYLARMAKLKSDLPRDSSPLGISLRGFHDTYFVEKEKGLNQSDLSPDQLTEQLNELQILAEKSLLQQDGYTREEICQMLDVDLEEFHTRYISKFPIKAERFMLRQRAIHVFSEARRVLEFMKLLSSPPQGSDDDLFGALGALMNSTQDSCRNLYECSCAELDEVCDIARQAGAYGSRLTGAGWGGCSVHLVPKSKIVDITEALTQNYYNKRFPDLAAEKLAEAVVVSKPGSGSCIFHFGNPQSSQLIS